MKIAIEAQRIFRKEKHGMDYVALETIRELQKIDKQNEYFILVSPGDDICLQESANVHIVTVNWPSYPLWEQIGLPLALRKIKPDLLHCTSNTAPVYGNIPLVLTLHDIIFLEKKQGKNQSMYQRLGRFYRRIIVPQILTRCKRIITVEDGAILGGLYSAISEFVASRSLNVKVEGLGIPDQFIEQGTIPQLKAECGYDKEGILKSILNEPSHR